jgi:hypothetical protein
MKKKITYLLLASVLMLGVMPVMAQNLMPEMTGDVPATAPLDGVADTQTNTEIAPKQIAAISMPSLLFNYWEQTAIVEAKKSAESVGLTRGVTDDEINRAMNEPLDQERVKPPPEERNITLGGILYSSQDEWTIWLNGERVTPDALPEEVIDLRVYKHHVDMKWQDEYTRRLYPIRLRAHQRFNLVNRMFLPG